jgi:hypothetical protein
MVRIMGAGAALLLAGVCGAAAPACAQTAPTSQPQAQAQAQAQTQAQTQANSGPDAPVAPPRRSKAPKAHPQDAFSALQVMPWFSLAPEGAGLIRAPSAPNAMDLAARDDDTYITVYGKKKTGDLHADREHDFSAPGWSDYVMPKELPIGTPGSCSSGAYRTIGGQPATGADLVGGLGGGRC